MLNPVSDNFGCALPSSAALHGPCSHTLDFLAFFFPILISTKKRQLTPRLLTPLPVYHTHQRDEQIQPGHMEQAPSPVGPSLPVGSSVTLRSQLLGRGARGDEECEGDIKSKFQVT